MRCLRRMTPKCRRPWRGCRRTAGSPTPTAAVIACLVLGRFEPALAASDPQPQVKVLSSYGASSARHLPPPSHLRLEIIAVSWAGGPNFPYTHTDTMAVWVKRGDDLDGPREYDGWNFARGGPFFLGTIVDSRHCWIRYCKDVVPEIGGRAPGDSIQVSTVWRSFYTPSFDAGIRFRIRIVPPAEGAPSQGMQVVPSVPRSEDRNQLVGSGKASGTLRLTDSGQPIGGAKVSLRGLPLRTSSSDVGRFEFDDVPIGHQVLVVQDEYGDVSATIEVNDESARDLAVFVSRPYIGEVPLVLDDPQGEPPPSWNRRVDVWPLQFTDRPPVYPVEARRKAFEGDVHVMAWIDSLGLVRHVKVAHPVSPGLDSIALEYAKTCRFRPALLGGHPVAGVAGVRVHFGHPLSSELVPPADRRDSVVAPASRGRGNTSFAIEASARFDSVTSLYTYAYRLENHGRQNLIAAFALMPLVGEIEDLGAPPGWNCFIGCGGRYDVVGGMAWNDGGSDLRAQMIQPGELLDGFAFKSRHPPGRIRWFAQAVPRGFKGAFPWQCMSADTSLMTGSGLQGTTVGPVPARRGAR